MTFPHAMTKQGFLTEKYSISEDGQKTKVTSGNWQCWKLQYRLNKHNNHQNIPWTNKKSSKQSLANNIESRKQEKHR